jgi:hypothetical protein
MFQHHRRAYLATASSFLSSFVKAKMSFLTSSGIVFDAIEKASFVMSFITSTARFAWISSALVTSMDMAVSCLKHHRRAFGVLGLVSFPLLGRRGGVICGGDELTLVGITLHVNKKSSRNPTIVDNSIFSTSGLLQLDL